MRHVDYLMCVPHLLWQPCPGCCSNIRRFIRGCWKNRHVAPSAFRFLCLDLPVRCFWLVSSHCLVDVNIFYARYEYSMRFQSTFYEWHAKLDEYLFLTDELSAKEEARQSIIDGREGYTKADLVVKLSGWDPEYAQTVAQSCLSALKQLILSDKKLPGTRHFHYG